MLVVSEFDGNVDLVQINPEARVTLDDPRSPVAVSFARQNVREGYTQGEELRDAAIRFDRGPGLPVRGS
jgi:hypothetical protein